MSARAARPVLHRLADRVGQLSVLDAPAETVAKAIRQRLRPGPVKDALSGTALGHPLHPLLTDLPIGMWTSAVVLDVVGGDDARPAARRLIAGGLLAAVPTAASGWSDWADSTPASDAVRRVGAIHAVANVTAVGLYAASLLARRRGHHAGGVALGIGGLGALGVAGHLGGHLAYAMGIGVDQRAFDEPSGDWVDVLSDDELPPASPRLVEVDGQPVVVVRTARGIHALADRCVHRGGPLHEGSLIDDCIECPWHGSRFRLEDGSVERGPAAYPQPAYEVEVREGRIAVRPVT